MDVGCRAAGSPLPARRRRAPAFAIVMLTVSEDTRTCSPRSRRVPAATSSRTWRPPAASMLDAVARRGRDHAATAARILTEFARRRAPRTGTRPADGARARGAPPRRRRRPQQGDRRTLGISENTVKFHLGNILGKVHAQSRTEAGARAVREGLVPARRTRAAPASTCPYGPCRTAPAAQPDCVGSLPTRADVAVLASPPTSSATRRRHGLPHRHRPRGCITCGICMDVCPVEALDMRRPTTPGVERPGPAAAAWLMEHPLQVGECIGCGICVRECPPNVITGRCRRPGAARRRQGPIERPAAPGRAPGSRCRP